MKPEPYEGSPHGYVGAGLDLSPRPRSASGDPTSHVTEHALFHAYRTMDQRRVEACVCGGEIEAEDDYRAIADAVDLHNASTLHQQWRAWNELRWAAA